MSLLKTLVWSVACISLGIGLATAEVKGQTPWQHLRGLTSKTPKLEAVRGEVDGALVAARQKLKSSAEAPTESHLESERDAVNQLVARRGKH